MPPSRPRWKLTSSLEPGWNGPSPVIPAHPLLPGSQSACSPRRGIDKDWLRPYSVLCPALRKTNKMRIWLTDSENELWLLEGGDSQGVWDGHGPTATFSLDNQEGPTASFSLDDQQGPPLQHGGLCSALCGSLDGRGFGDDGYRHTCGWDPPLFTCNYHSIVNRL